MSVKDPLTEKRLLSGTLQAILLNVRVDLFRLTIFVKHLGAKSGVTILCKDHSDCSRAVP